MQQERATATSSIEMHKNLQSGLGTKNTPINSLTMVVKGLRVLHGSGDEGGIMLLPCSSESALPSPRPRPAILKVG